MINIKSFFVLLICVLLFNTTHAQSKYGNDSLACMESRAIYNMHYKQKNYDFALASWRKAFNICPASSENIFKHGPIIMKHKMKKDPQNKLLYLDTLMLIFDKRIEYFGKEGYVLGLKGYELVIANPKRSQEAFDMLSKSIDSQGNKSGPQQVYGYFKAVVNLERAGFKNESDVLEAYSYIMQIIDYNIENESKQTKYFVKYLDKIESIFANYANCDDLLNLFSSKYENSKEDIAFLNRAAKLLSDKDCTSSELFFNISTQLYSLEPTPQAAYQMSKMNLSRGKISYAINYAIEALDLENDVDKKAKIHILLAESYRMSGAYLSAKAEVYKALDIKRGWGKAYITLGNIYVSGAKKCGNDFQQAAVFWIAVDTFKKALNDEKYRDNASRSINTYSKQFPNKEACFFNGLEEGQKYSVECWINQSTIVRTRD